jgi:phage head maturation protease
MTKSAMAPRGWSPASISKRFAGTSAPSTYNAEAHTVDAVLSEGTGVQRFYGTEELLISSAAIDTSRVTSGNCPFLDSHNAAGISNALGRITTTWIKGGALWGRISFNQTPEGRMAEGMIGVRGELRGVSCGYSVQEWSCRDENGDAVNVDSVGWDDTGLTFVGTRWTLFEVSAVSIPADNAAGVRSLTIGGDNIDDVRTRANVRHRMHARQRMTAAQGRVIGRK